MTMEFANSHDQQTALNFLRTAVQDTAATFREGQWEAIDAVVNRRARLLVVQRTGWGKSSVYFIATRLLRDRGRGPMLVVSPLLALMRNQIDSAERHGVRAVRIDRRISRIAPISAAILMACLPLTAMWRQDPPC